MGTASKSMHFRQLTRVNSRQFTYPYYSILPKNMEEGKSTTYMKFGTTLPVDYIAKVDDDTVLAIQLLLQLMEDDLPPIPYNKRIYGRSGWGSRAHNHVYAAGQF